MKKRKNETAFNKFDEVMSRLLQVPHSEIKAKLDAEKAAKMKSKRVKNDSRNKNNDRT